jgi:hypothetical protein
MKDKAWGMKGTDVQAAKPPPSAPLEGSTTELAPWGAQDAEAGVISVNLHSEIRPSSTPGASEATQTSSTPGSSEAGVISVPLSSQLQTSAHAIPSFIAADEPHHEDAATGQKPQETLVDKLQKYFTAWFHADMVSFVGFRVGDRVGRDPLVRASLLGSLYGLLHAMAPDHLGTLAALGAAAGRGGALLAGTAWGLGHSLGAVLVGAALVLMHHATPATFEVWELYGDYFIGISMIACAFYFILRESKYLEEQPDGTYVLQTCACQSHRTQYAFEQQRQPAQTCFNCDESLAADVFPHKLRNAHSCQESLARQQPILAPQRLQPCAGAILGIFQGICCPMGLMGVSFLASLPLAGVFCFLVTFVAFSSLCTGAIAMGWAHATHSGIAGISPRILYRTTCGLTLVLGVLWLAATYVGIATKLDYTEFMSSSLIPQ